MNKRALMWERDHKDGTNCIKEEVTILAETEKAFKFLRGKLIRQKKWLPKKLYDGSPRFEFISVA